MPRFRRIRITGGSGSGKTFLGERISALTGIPLTSLDAIRYDFSTSHRFDTLRPLAEQERLLAKEMSGDRWLIEGGYYSTWKHTYDACDVLLYLRPSMPRRLLNITRRFLSRLLRGRYEGLGSFLSLTWYNLRSVRKWQYHRPKLFGEEYPERFHCFSSADEAYAWFRENWSG